MPEPTGIINQSGIQPCRFLRPNGQDFMYQFIHNFAGRGRARVHIIQQPKPCIAFVMVNIDAHGRFQENFFCRAQPFQIAAVQRKEQVSLLRRFRADEQMAVRNHAVFPCVFFQKHPCPPAAFFQRTRKGKACADCVPVRVGMPCQKHCSCPQNFFAYGFKRIIRRSHRHHSPSGLRKSDSSAGPYGSHIPQIRPA